MAGEVEISDILAAIREGRISEAAAASWLEMRLQEARQSRQVRAHLTPGMRNRLITALDSALSGDEFAGLFPPTAPLGPEPGGGGEHPPAPKVYPGEQQGQRNRTPRTGYASAAQDGDDLDEEYRRLFGDS